MAFVSALSLIFFGVIALDGWSPHPLRLSGCGVDAAVFGRRLSWDDGEDFMDRCIVVAMDGCG